MENINNGIGTTNPNPCPAVSNCHDIEYFPCGCSRCKRCGIILKCGQSNTPYFPYGQGTNPPYYVGDYQYNKYNNCSSNGTIKL